MTVLAPGPYLIELEFSRRIDYATLTRALEKLGFVQITPDDTAVGTAIGAVSRSFALTTTGTKPATTTTTTAAKPYYPAVNNVSNPAPAPAATKPIAAATTTASQGLTRAQAVAISANQNIAANQTNLADLAAQIAEANRRKAEAEAAAARAAAAPKTISVKATLQPTAPAISRAQAQTWAANQQIAANQKTLAEQKAKIEAAYKAKQEAEARAKAAAAQSAANKAKVQAPGQAGTAPGLSRAKAVQLAAKAAPEATLAEEIAASKKRREEAEKAKAGKGKLGFIPSLDGTMSPEERAAAAKQEEAQLQKELAAIEAETKRIEEEAKRAAEQAAMQQPTQEAAYDAAYVNASQAIDPSVYGSSPLAAAAMADSAATAAAEKYAGQNFQGWQDSAALPYDPGAGAAMADASSYGGYGGGQTPDPFAALSPEQIASMTPEELAAFAANPEAAAAASSDDPRTTLNTSAVLDLWRKWAEWGSPFATAPNVAGEDEENVPYRVRLIAHLRNPLRIFDQPGMKWLYVRKLGLSPFGDLDFSLRSFPLRRGATYELRFLARSKAMPTRDLVKQGLVDMGFAPMKLSVLKRNMRVPGRGNADVTLWYAIASWEKGNSAVSMSDPLFFLDAKEITS